MIQLRDYSHWEPNPDLAADKAVGVLACIDKATDGLTTDDTYLPRRARERAAGFLTGGYHYYRDTVDPVRQARYHCEVNPDRVKVLDLEPGYNPTFTRDNTPGELIIVKNKIRACLVEIRARTGVQPLIYTNWNTWHYLLGEPAWGAEYGLWVASYPRVLTTDSRPLLPSTWQSWVIWQSADHTDWFGGPEAALRELFGGATVSQPVVTHLTVEERLARLEQMHNLV